MRICLCERNIVFPAAAALLLPPIPLFSFRSVFLIIVIAFFISFEAKYVKREVRELLDEDWDAFLDALATL